MQYLLIMLHISHAEAPLLVPENKKDIINYSFFVWKRLGLQTDNPVDLFQIISSRFFHVSDQHNISITTAKFYYLDWH